MALIEMNFEPFAVSFGLQSDSLIKILIRPARAKRFSQSNRGSGERLHKLRELQSFHISSSHS